MLQCGGRSVTGVAVWGSGCDWCCSVSVGRYRCVFRNLERPGIK